ncbi:MAG: hypothetical protein Q8T11_01890 [Elusimicrobiota bacterium]|nr:hypothetical protein [Elusimicrobiota bacterium]
MFAPAPALPPVSLEAAYVSARAATQAAEDPISILNRAAPPAEKLAALERLHASLPSAPQARRALGLEAMRATAVSSREAPSVRAKALLYLGYSVPVVGDEKARAAAIAALLDAARAPAYRVFALRGLAPATHDLPPASEAPVQETLLDLLASTLTAEERITALVALDAFVRSREDLPRRRPDLAAALDAGLVAPLAADPAAFAAGGPPAVRALTIAVVWHAARARAATGEPEALARVGALLTTLMALETDPSVKAQISAFLAAPPPELV